MKKYILTCLIGCFAALSMNALAAAPGDSLTSVAAIPKRNLSEIFVKKFQINVGFDPEKTPYQRLEYIAFKSKISISACLLYKIRENWYLRPEVGFMQFATPRVTVMSYEKYLLDGPRIQVWDTTSVVRMAGYNIGASIVRNLPAGFSVMAGVQCGWYKKGITESGAYAVDLEQNSIRSNTLGNGSNSALPYWFEGVQPGLRFGLEKVFVKRLVLGTSIYQGLQDITALPEGGKNYSTNFQFYIGLKI